jgi:hypothetical protein
MGLKFAANLNETTKINFDGLISTVKFMLRQHSIRNLNIIQKSWFANTFVLSKLWYVSQVIPPGNSDIAQLKTAVGRHHNLPAGLLIQRAACPEIDKEHERMVEPQHGVQHANARDNENDLQRDAAEEKYRPTNRAEAASCRLEKRVAKFNAEPPTNRLDLNCILSFE